MNTSSSDGRETLTERIGMAEILGEQARHELLAVGHAERDRPFGHHGLDPEALAQRRDRGVVIAGLDLHAVLADARLQRLGRVERDDLAAGP